ncbi:MAG: S8 family serine peptidase [Candidatus Aenigmatarchaeota archaeon]
MNLSPIIIAVIIAVVVISGVVGVSYYPAGEFRAPLRTLEPTIITAPLEPACTPSIEKCDGIDNDCDGLVDEEEVCEEPERINPPESENLAEKNSLGFRAYEQRPNFNGYLVQLRDAPVVEYKTRSQTALSKSILSNYKNNIIEKQSATITQIINLAPKASITKSYSDVFNGFFVSEISQKEAEDIKKIAEVKEVYPNYEVKMNLMDAVPLINADDVWAREIEAVPITGEGITIGIIDTGVDYTHPDLGGCFGAGCKVEGGYDIVNDDPDPIDDEGHGTHCAASAAGNGIINGIAPDAKIYAYKVLNSRGSGTFDAVIEGIEMSADPNQDENFDDHLDIISLSLGADCWGYSEFCGPEDPVSQAVNNIVDLGVIAVIAAGNSGPREETVGSPGTAKKAITVGATYKKNYDDFWWNCTSSPFNGVFCGEWSCPAEGQIWCQYWEDSNPIVDQITSFSSRGPVIWDNGAIYKPDVVAPGAITCAARYDSIFPEGEHPYYHPCLDDQHLQVAGTSMATPIVAGAVALLKQSHPDWSPLEIKAALRNTAVDIGEPIGTQGQGRIDIAEAFNLTSPLVAEIETNGAIEGLSIDFIGTAMGGGFSYYDLYISERNLENWDLICTSDIPKESEVLCAGYDPSALNGDYDIKLSVYPSTGDISEDASVIIVENIKIKSPKYYSEITHGNSINIIGNANAENFERYTLEYVKAEYTGYALFKPNEDFIPIQTGFSPIINGVLGTFDTSGIVQEDSYYFVYLSVYNSGGVLIGEERTLYYIEDDSGIQTGWPVLLDSISSVSSISAADYDGDSDLEVSFANQNFGDDPEFYSWHHDGSPVTGWPTFKSSGTTSAIGDINNDGELEIAITHGARLHVFNTAGDELFRYHTNQGGSLIPSMGDIDNDGYLEIIIGDSDPILKVFDHEGNFYPGYPLNLDEPEYPDGGAIYGQAIADINDDGYLDVVFGTATDKVYAYTLHNQVKLWEYSLPGTPGVPIIGDLDCNGQEEIIFGMNNHPEMKIYVLDKDGNLFPGWPQESIATSTFHNYNIPSLGDIDGDCNLEIVYSTYWYDLNMWHHDGTVVDGWPKHSLGGWVFTQAVIGDITGDNLPDVISYAGSVYSGPPGNQMVVAYHGDGTPIEGFPKQILDHTCMMIYSTPLINDIDNDGDVELVTHSGPNIDCEGSWVGDLTAKTWDLDNNYDSSTMEWPQYQHDSYNTGFYGFELTTKSSLPCNTGQQIGDVNGDGVINHTDSDLANDIAFVGDIPTPEDICCIDVDMNDRINLVDVVRIIAIANGDLESPGMCPVCEGDITYGECSTRKPLFCDSDGSFSNDCNKCGCYSGYTCDINGLCKRSIVDNCMQIIGGKKVNTCDPSGGLPVDS